MVLGSGVTAGRRGFGSRRRVSGGRVGWSVGGGRENGGVASAMRRRRTPRAPVASARQDAREGDGAGGRERGSSVPKTTVRSRRRERRARRLAAMTGWDNALRRQRVRHGKGARRRSGHGQRDMRRVVGVSRSRAMLGAGACSGLCAGPAVKGEQVRVGVRKRWAEAVGGDVGRRRWEVGCEVPTRRRSDGAARERRTRPCKANRRASGEWVGTGCGPESPRGGDRIVRRGSSARGCEGRTGAEAVGGVESGNGEWGEDRLRAAGCGAPAQRRRAARRGCGARGRDVEWTGSDSVRVGPGEGGKRRAARGSVTGGCRACQSWIRADAYRSCRAFGRCVGLSSARARALLGCGPAVACHQRRHGAGGRLAGGRGDRSRT